MSTYREALIKETVNRLSKNKIISETEEKEDPHNRIAHVISYKWSKEKNPNYRHKVLNWCDNTRMFNGREDAENFLKNIANHYRNTSEMSEFKVEPFHETIPGGAKPYRYLDAEALSQPYNASDAARRTRNSGP